MFLRQKSFTIYSMEGLRLNRQIDVYDKDEIEQRRERNRQKKQEKRNKEENKRQNNNYRRRKQADRERSKEFY